MIKYSFKLFCNGIIKNKVKDIPDIRTFINNNEANKNKTNNNINTESLINSPINYTEELNNNPKTFFIETYGCQMNENDTEIISSILIKNNFEKVNKIEDAEIIFANTCAIRESAEEKVWNQIDHYRGIKKRHKTKIFGILGCMAERMKEKILERSNNVIELIAGPDSYRDLPKMINIISRKDDSESKFAMNVQLSLEETYADIMPVRKSEDSKKAFLSVMRGCNNMCSFCIVPFTRGRERSREFNSIIEEVKLLRDSGVKEITLLGQNVNSYIDETFQIENELTQTEHKNSTGFKELYKLRNKKGLRFADLLYKVAQEAPEVRFRFTSPHPKDFPDHLIEVIKRNHNICKQIHLPIQSGNNKVLKDMRRYYTREAYLDLVKEIRAQIPQIALSTDVIAGFCGETEEEFKDTITLLEDVRFDMAYLFAYSMREKTHAYHHLKDDVSQEDKKRRLAWMIDVFRKHSLEVMKKEVGTYQIVLIENEHRKDKSKLVGRTDTNKLVIFDKVMVNEDLPGKVNDSDSNKVELNYGDYAMVKITSCSTTTMYGDALCKIKRMKDFFELSNGNPYINKLI